MKKITLLAFLLAGALCASAVTPISKTVTKNLPKSKTEVSFKVNHAVQASTTLRAPITEAPEGEVKYYKRTGSCLYISGQYITPGDQEGTIELTYAADNKVWFKNIFYGVADAYGDSYVYGTLSDDGTKITVPMGQSIYYSDYYSADVVLSWGTTSVSGTSIVWTPDADVNEAVYLIDGTTLTLQGGGPAPTGSDYPDYEGNGLGCTWSDDGSFGGFLEWGTVLTEFDAAVLPTNVAVEPAATSADVTWEGKEGNSWDLRYREYIDPAETNRFIDLPNDEEILDQQLNGVYVYDADGDGNNWGLATTDDAETDLCFTSASFSGGALTPDNWLIFPAKLGGSLKFTAKNYSSTYADPLAVFVATNSDLDAVIEAGGDALTKVGQTITPGSTEWTSYEFDLSAYEGMGFIIIRHYNVTDMWRVYVDDVEITVPDPKEIPDWTVVEDVESPYTIDGLTPETDYEVQVMAYNDEDESNWTSSTYFTTLAEGQEEGIYYVLGFNDWSNPIEIGEEGATVTVAAQDFENPEDTAQEFKVVTPDGNDGWIWFGGEDANGVGYFEITEDLLGVGITLDDAGANFRLPEAGTYTIQLAFLREAVPGMRMVVTKESTTAIESIKSDVKGDNNYYNLMGQKVSGNLPAGIYIHNGKKIVVK